MCGIFGQINAKYDKFDKKFFNMAGIINDSRGGDSCGVMIDGSADYGVDKFKTYIEFFKESDVILDTKQCRVAIGHTRKASVGAINVTTAQPVCIYDDAGNILFSLVHNGTIRNYKELAIKYNVDHPDSYTDSMVVAKIIFEKGFDVLGEYIGAAAMVAVDYRNNNMNPDVFFFKGFSKQSQYGYSKPEEERPLYYARDENNLYFSSIKSVLIGCVSCDIFTLRDNELLKLNENGKFHLVKKYDREKTMEDHYKVTKKEYSNYANDFLGKKELGAVVKANAIVNCHTNAVSNKIIFDECRYMHCVSYNKKVVANGKFNLSSYGYVMPEYQNLYRNVYCFINGMYISSEEVYDAIMDLKKEYCKTFNTNYPMVTDDAAESSFNLDYTDELRMLAYGGLAPVIENGSLKIYQYEYFSGMISKSLYTGEFIPLFNPYTIAYVIDNGDIVGRKELRGTCSTEFIINDITADSLSFRAIDVLQLFLNA